MPTRIDTARVQELLAEGAQIVDVLPAETFKQEHIPGAINIPLAEISSAVDALVTTKPVIVYCYDYQCDLSARGASRLETLGFREVYDYVASKVAWLADGLPSAGLVDDDDRAVSRLHRDVPTVRADASMKDVFAAVADWELVVVVDERGVVLGVVRAEAANLAPDTPVAQVMQPAPPTVRPSIPLRELAETMDHDGQRHLLVTTLSGKLLGLVRRSELESL
jgi:rhodanese-related sulfurtransferase/CBS domain-containing protein